MNQLLLKIILLDQNGVKLKKNDLAENKLNTLQKSLFEPRPAEFLYDIENDQWETTNLIDNPATKEVLEKMRKLLDDEILQARDVMFLPEYELGLISKTTTPYEYRLNATNYPFKQIYNAASLSGKRGKAIAAQQINLLKSDDKIIRYWAITGLRSQSAHVLKPYQSQIFQAMQDVYPPVAVTASAISYNEFNNATAEVNLKKYSLSQNPDIALLSINFLLYVHNKQPFISTIKAVHEMTGRSYDVKAAAMDFLGSIGLVPNNPKYEE